MTTEIKNDKKMNKEPKRTIEQAVFLENFTINFLTIGSNEQAITKDAKNIIATSDILNINMIKRIAKIKNMMFFAVIYLGKIFSNILNSLSIKILSRFYSNRIYKCVEMFQFYFFYVHFFMFFIILVEVLEQKNIT